MTQSLYFIQAGDDGPIKIGITKDIKTRMRFLQNGNGRKLSLLHILECGNGKAIEYEKKLHEKFSAFRKQGEWFHPHKFIIKTIEDIKEGGMDGLYHVEHWEGCQAINSVMVGYNLISETARDLKNKGDSFLYHYVIREVEELLSDLKSGKV